MPREESLYSADWLRIAEKDLGRVEHLLDVHDPEAAGFFLQQAVEKFLKAFLLSKGWELERIHYYGKPGVDRLIRVDYHGSKEVPTGTCNAILKAAGLKEKRK